MTAGIHATAGNLGDLSSPPRKASVFALVISINVYKSPSIPDLSGCINDGKDLYDYLTKGPLAVPHQNILTLFNESASRDNILAAFRSHLIHNDRISQDDLIVVFYAGHGDSVEVHGWNTDGRKVETICPYDLTAFSPDDITAPDIEPATPIFAIPDRTINALMRQLAKAKGDNIVAIFDCCHSGGIARDPVTMTSRSLSSHITVPARRPLPPDLDKELFQGVFDTMPSTGARGLEFTLPSGFAYSSTKSHVLLAACQPNEKAREENIGSTHRGRFTYHLLQYLREVSRRDQDLPITYTALVEEVSMKLALGNNTEAALRGQFGALDPSALQRPHCEGRHKHRFLFSTQEEARTDTFPLAYRRVQPERQEEALYVLAGSMQGITKDTQFVFRYGGANPESLSPNILTLVPCAVEADRSRVVSTRNGGGLAPAAVLAKGMLPKHAMASVSTWHLMPMKIWCASGVPLAVPLERSRYRRVKYHDDADAWCSRYQLDGSPNKYLFQKRDPLSLHFNYATPMLTLPTPITEDDAILNAISQFNYHLYRYNTSSAVRNDLRFGVRLRPLQLRDNIGLHQILDIAGGDQPDLLAAAQTHHFRAERYSTYNICEDSGVREAIVTDVGPKYGLTVVNQSHFALFVYVFYFDPADYSISDWYHPPNPAEAPLPRDGELAVGYGTDVQETFKFSLSMGIKGETGFVKVFVSNVYVDMSNIVQQSPLDVLAGVSERKISKVPMSAISGWNSALYALTVMDPTQ